MKRVETIKVFVGTTRPSHDSAPMAQCDLTEAETRTLRNLIGKYLAKCKSRRGFEGRIKQGE